MPGKGAGVVSFLTDYGLDDPYVGEVKARMLSVCKDVKIVDVTHSVEPQNVLQGAFLLYVSHRFFPEGTVHLAVVDPGVGTGRRGVVIVTRRYWFVGPDNGLLYPAAHEDGIVGCYEIELEGYQRYGGETFHGRDVFGPVAAEIACGLKPKLREVNPETIVRLELGRAEVTGERVRTRVLHIDRFGNCITDLRSQDLPPWFGTGRSYRVRVEGRELSARFLRAYADAAPGELLLTLGGTGFLEVSVNRGSAAKELSLRIGSEVVIEKAEQDG